MDFEGVMMFEPGSFSMADNVPVKLSDGTVVGRVIEWWRDGDTIMIRVETEGELDL